MSANKLIYALVEPSGEIRYIGKSTSGLKRPRRHRQPAVLAANNQYSGRWIRSLQARGETYSILILEYVIDSESGELEDAERRWIKFGRESGWRLTNLTDGGEGTPGWVPSAETRDRMSKSNRVASADPNYRRALSERTRKQMSSVGARAQISSTLLGHSVSPEARAKMSTSKRGRKLSAAHRAKMAIAQQQRRLREQT
jgi:hypothetical protein